MTATVTVMVEIIVIHTYTRITIRKGKWLMHYHASPCFLIVHCFLWWKNLMMEAHLRTMRQWLLSLLPLSSSLWSVCHWTPRGYLPRCQWASLRPQNSTSHCLLAFCCCRMYTVLLVHNQNHIFTCHHHRHHHGGHCHGDIYDTASSWWWPWF